MYLQNKECTLRQIEDHVYTYLHPLTIFGVDFHMRMAIVRYFHPQNKNKALLWVHSPIPLNDELQIALENIGQVSIVVSPNCQHHLFAEDWMKAFPDAEFWAAPGLPEKREDLSFDYTLDQTPSEMWPSNIDKTPILGMPTVNEYVFFDQVSSFLFVTEFCSLLPEGNWQTYAFAWLNNIHKRIGQPYLFKYQVKDKEAFVRSLHIMLTWNFRRIHMCHNRIITEQAKSSMKHAVRWIFKEPRLRW